MSKKKFNRKLCNALVHTVCDCIADGQTIFEVEDTLKTAFPGVPFGIGGLRDARNVWGSVVKKVTRLEDRPLVPLTAYFFDECDCVVPDIKDEARKCVSGIPPYMGKSVGFKIAEKDILTGIWRESSHSSANGRMKSENERTKKVCSELGIASPKDQLEKELLQLGEE